MRYIVKHLAGSRAYGTNVATSDTDYRGIFLEDPLLKFLGRGKETIEMPEGDETYHELTKFVDLAIAQNPNILETLFVSEKHIVGATHGYEILRRNANLFLSSGVANSYLGYAKSQLSRLQNHNKWIVFGKEIDKELLRKVGLSGEAEIAGIDDDTLQRKIEASGIPARSFAFLARPRQVEYLRIEYNLTSDARYNGTSYPHLPEQFWTGSVMKKVSGDLYAIQEFDGLSAINKDGSLNDLSSQDFSIAVGHDFSKALPQWLVKFDRTAYERDSADHNAFLEWKRTRNSKRLELEVEHGYDTKFMMHAIRLLTQGREILEGKGLIVDRTGIDAKTLLAIRAGEWSFEKAMDFANRLMEDCKTAERNTKLPKKPSIDRNEIICQVHEAEGDILPRI